MEVVVFNVFYKGIIILGLKNPMETGFKRLKEIVKLFSPLFIEKDHRKDEMWWNLVRDMELKAGETCTTFKWNKVSKSGSGNCLFANSEFPGCFPISLLSQHVWF